MTLREILKRQDEVSSKIEIGENAYTMYIDQSPLTYNEILVSLYVNDEPIYEDIFYNDNTIKEVVEDITKQGLCRVDALTELKDEMEFKGANYD